MQIFPEYLICIFRHFSRQILTKSETCITALLTWVVPLNPTNSHVFPWRKCPSISHGCLVVFFQLGAHSITYAWLWQIKPVLMTLGSKTVGLLQVLKHIFEMRKDFFSKWRKTATQLQPDPPEHVLWAWDNIKARLVPDFHTCLKLWTVFVQKKYKQQAGSLIILKWCNCTLQGLLSFENIFYTSGSICKQ